MPAIPPVPILDQIDTNGKRTMVGPLVLPAGSAVAPSLVLGGYGFFLNPAVPPGSGPPGIVAVTTGARRTVMAWDYGLRLAGFTELAWTDQGGIADKPETGLALHHDVNNQLAQRNGLNPQSYVVYNTWTDASHFERLNVGWSSSVATITTQKGSAGGSAHDLVLGADDMEILRFASGSKIGLFGSTPVIQQTSPTLVNNVASGGTSDVVNDFADGDWAALRSALYQVTRKLKETQDALKAYGLLNP